MPNPTANRHAPSISGSQANPIRGSKFDDPNRSRGIIGNALEVIHHSGASGGAKRLDLLRLVVEKAGIEGVLRFIPDGTQHGVQFVAQPSGRAGSWMRCQSSSWKKKLNSLIRMPRAVSFPLESV